MEMDTPIGQFLSTKNLKDFVELNSLSSEQYLLAISDDIIGEGAKIKGSNFNSNLVSADENNILTINEDGKLFVDGSDIKASGGGLEIGDIGTALYIDETKGLRRYLNGTLLTINTNTQDFLNWLKNVVTLYPSLATTEENWQAEKTISKLGQCGKFVINETAGTIRLPRVINIQGLVDLSNAGVAIPESLPNINAKIKSNGGIDAQFYVEVKDTITYDGAFANKDGTYTCRAISGASSTYQVPYDLSFDASLSSSTYQDNAPVQQEAIQYPYFIQIATGQETEVDIVNEIELNNPFSLFDSRYSDHELNNLSWLRSNGQWNSGTVYINAYNLLLRLYNGTETIEGISVKAVGDSPITDYDFVIDTANMQFKLPIKTNLASGKAVVGNGIAIGYTNGTVNFGYVSSANVTTSGQSPYVYGYDVGTVSSSAGLLPADGRVIGLTTDPTKSGIELADSNLYLYYYVGDTVQNANLINAGRIEETLAGKEDIDTWVYWQEGTEGYRYNKRNGYCEQWGHTGNGTNAEITITLLKTMKDANYQAYKNNSWYYANNANTSYYNIYSKTVNSFKTFNGNQQVNGTGFDWIVRGYLAEDQY